MKLLEKSVSNYLYSPLEQSKKLKLVEWYLDHFEQKKVLSEFERTKEELEDTLTGASGKINVGAMVVAMPTLLSPAIARLN